MSFKEWYALCEHWPRAPPDKLKRSYKTRGLFTVISKLESRKIKWNFSDFLLLSPLPQNGKILCSATRTSKRKGLSFYEILFSFRLLVAEGYSRFADRFDRILNKALVEIPMDHTSVEGCVTRWAPHDEDRTTWDPATATKCQYARKVARSFLRWTENNLCLDNLSRGGTSVTKGIARKFDNVIDFMWNSKYCEDEEPWIF